MWGRSCGARWARGSVAGGRSKGVSLAVKGASLACAAAVQPLTRPPPLPAAAMLAYQSRYSRGEAPPEERDGTGAGALPDLGDVARRLAAAHFVCVAACHVAKPPAEGAGGAACPAEDLRVLAVGYNAGSAASPELLKISATPPFSARAWKTCALRACVRACLRACCSAAALRACSPMRPGAASAGCWATRLQADGRRRAAASPRCASRGAGRWQTWLRRVCSARALMPRSPASAHATSH